MTSVLDNYLPLISYLLVWALLFVVGFVLKAEKHGIIVKPYYLMLKTVVFNSWMERLGGRFRRFWLTYFDIGAAIGIGLLIFVIYSFIKNAINLLYQTPQAGPTLLIIPLPGVTISWEIFPYILIAIAALLIPHEVAHGIASVIDRVPIKSSGVFLAVFLPGGFVEIDEENLAKRKAATKLRVFAAGSSTNVVSWFFVFIALTSLFQPVPSGVLVTGLVSGGAAQNSLPQWSVITRINNSTITQARDLSAALVKISPGTNVTVGLNNGQLVYITPKPAANNASRAVLGISVANYYATRLAFLSVPAAYQVLTALNWLSLILLGVALVNMLPLFPFDGDRYFDTVLGLAKVKNTKYIRMVASIVSLSLLLSNLILSYLRFGTIFPG
ncbi:MAG TPA: site-2 protease family protein [Candidatus Bathyarchaeia archaeon]|nr:site-2 protease family protein [Candidatus Bathyarchaeia archaeon]